MLHSALCLFACDLSRPRCAQSAALQSRERAARRRVSRHIASPWATPRHTPSPAAASRCLSFSDGEAAERPPQTHFGGGGGASLEPPPALTTQPTGTRRPPPHRGRPPSRCVSKAPHALCEAPYFARRERRLAAAPRACRLCWLDQRPAGGGSHTRSALHPRGCKARASEDGGSLPWFFSGNFRGAGQPRRRRHKWPADTDAVPPRDSHWPPRSL